MGLCNGQRLHCMFSPNLSVTAQYKLTTDVSSNDDPGGTPQSRKVWSL
jgi:hypothetical protein